MTHDPQALAVLGGVVVCVIAVVCDLFGNNKHESN